jgi:hypothetical protein
MMNWKALRTGAQARDRGAEVPQAPFEISARESAPTVILILDLDHNLGAGGLRTCVDGISVGDDHMALCVSPPPTSSGCLMKRPYGESFTDASMIIPLAKPSWAWTIVPFSPATTRCFSKPKVWQSQSMAAGVLRYRRHGMIVALVFLAKVGMRLASPRN